MVELPVWRGVPDDAARAIATVDAWASSPAMEMLTHSFRGDPGVRRGVELLDWLDRFSASHWDFRAGRERNLATEAALSADTMALVLGLAPALGLAGVERPLRRHYDTVLMTGGMVRAGIVKPRFVAALLGEGLTARTITFLGGFRVFGGDEPRLAAALGIDGRDEVDAMVSGLRRAFGPIGTPEVVDSIVENPNLSWREYRWETPAATLTVVAAPSADPQRRANSADTYRFWASRRSPAVRSVLQVTTPIYVPHQGAAAIEALGVGEGIAIETIGTDAAANDLGAHSQDFTAGHHLQELRSAIRSMRSLRYRLTA